MALDARWFQIMGLGMILHITNSCIIGFCGDMGLKQIGPDVGSTLFTFATLNLLTTQNLCPCVVANVNPIVARLFEVAASIFIADVTLVTVWQPLIKFVSAIPPFLGSVVQCVTTSFCVVDTAPVQWLLSILSAENADTAHVAVLIAAALLALWSAQSSDFFCQLRNLAQEKQLSSPSCLSGGEEASKDRETPSASLHRSRSRTRARSRSRSRNRLH